MSSRLFHAIVGVGISASATACSGLVDEAAHPVDASVHEASSAPDAAIIPIVADASIDVAIDAKGDADAAQVIDAFCDAPWPTTKGTPVRPACTNPQGTCTGSDGWSAYGCIQFTGPQNGPYLCNPGNVGQTWDFCVNGQWQCPTGWRHSNDCHCWGAVPSGYECTFDGFQKIGGGN